MNEVKFPIYKFSMEMVFENGIEGIYEYVEMVDEKTTKEELINELELVGEYLFNNNKEIEEIRGWYEFIEYETWCIGEKGFFTLNKFDNQEEALQSFERYADRKNIVYEDVTCMLTERVTGGNNSLN